MNLTQVIMAEVYKCQKSSTQKQKAMPDIIKIFTDFTFWLKKNIPTSFFNLSRNILYIKPCIIIHETFCTVNSKSTLFVSLQSKVCRDIVLTASILVRHDWKVADDVHIQFVRGRGEVAHLKRAVVGVLGQLWLLCSSVQSITEAQYKNS